MFFLVAQVTQILLFLRMPVLERSKITVGKRHLYKKKKIAMKVLGMCVPFIRRYFQEHQFLVLLKHRNIDSVIFRNAGFEEINNHSLRTTPFQKKIAMELLGMYLPYVKSYFWSTSELCFSLWLK